MGEPEDGRLAIERPGFSYLPRFIHEEESLKLIDYFAGLVPIWEQRHRGEEHGRSSGHGRRLTRPVYWLGAWQFACLGYYAEPDHREDRCLRGERLPAVMEQILERLSPREPTSCRTPASSTTTAVRSASECPGTTLDFACTETVSPVRW